MGVGFEEDRAYVLLRNSGLGAEDKKKLIVDADGDLKYKNIVSSLKLLGSRFLHELQSGSRSVSRSKTYDVNAIFEDETREKPMRMMSPSLGVTGMNLNHLWMRATPMP